MKRRDLITLIGSALVGWPLALRAQQPERLRRVSVLLGVPENDPETNSRLRAFRLGMRNAGWVEGRNIQTEYRYAGTDRDTIKKHVAELIRLAPECG
jgi:putative ABC transport system substrate-binding protein